MSDPYQKVTKQVNIKVTKFVNNVTEGLINGAESCSLFGGGDRQFDCFSTGRKGYTQLKKGFTVRV